MADKYENVIRQQEELIAGFMEQNAADAALIEAQKQQIHAQQ